jgi:hypothetical protein
VKRFRVFRAPLQQVYGTLLTAMAAIRLFIHPEYSFYPAGYCFAEYYLYTQLWCHGIGDPLPALPKQLMV